MHNDISEILFSEQDLAIRVRELGEAITRDYADVAGDAGIVVVSILRGGAVFTCDLIRAIDLPLEVDFMAVSSYGNGAKSSGVVRILKDLSDRYPGTPRHHRRGHHRFGLTLKYLLKNLQSREPASLTVAALMRKDTPAQADIPCRYIGFECPDEFIVGYGLDFAEHYRNLPYIGVLKPEIYQ